MLVLLEEYDATLSGCTVRSVEVVEEEVSPGAYESYVVVRFTDGSSLYANDPTLYAVEERS